MMFVIVLVVKMLSEQLETLQKRSFSTHVSRCALSSHFSGLNLHFSTFNVTLSSAFKYIIIMEKYSSVI